MQEFFYDIDGIKQVTREVMKPRLILRVIIFVIIGALSVFQMRDFPVHLWWMRLIPSGIIFVIFFVISPGILKARLKKAYERVRIRVSTEGMEIEQSNVKNILLLPHNIHRIVREPSGKFFTVYTDLPFKKIRIYCPLHDPEAFEKALNDLKPVETEKQKASLHSSFRLLLLVVTCAAYFFAFRSESFSTVLISFLLVLVFLVYSVYEAVLRLPVLKGSAAFLTIFYLFLGVALCVLIVFRLMHLYPG